MEIGVLAILIIISLSICWSEGTKIGRKFTEWALKNLIGIDTDELED
jgi:hypothetical protein